MTDYKIDDILNEFRTERYRTPENSEKKDPATQPESHTAVRRHSTPAESRFGMPEIPTEPAGQAPVRRNAAPIRTEPSFGRSETEKRTEPFAAAQSGTADVLSASHTTITAESRFDMPETRNVQKPESGFSWEELPLGRQTAPKEAPAGVFTDLTGSRDDFGSDFEQNVLQYIPTRSAASAVQSGEPDLDTRGQRARAAAVITSDFEEDDDDHARTRQRKGRTSENNRPQPARKKQAVQEESPEEVTDTVDRLRGGLRIRLAVSILAVLIILYAALSLEYPLPLPGFLEENTTLLYWIQAGMLAICALVNANTVGGGAAALFTLKPSTDSYAALSVFAGLMQGTFLALRPQQTANFFLPMSALILLCSTIGKLLLVERVDAVYQTVSSTSAAHTVGRISSPRLARRIIGGDAEDANIVCFTAKTGLDGYLDSALAPGQLEEISRVAAPMTAAAALLISIVAYLFHHDMLFSVNVFCGAICITAPLMIVLIADRPLAAVNKRLERWNSALCGYEAVEDLSHIDAVALSYADLFPKGSVTLHGIKAIRKDTLNQAITAAASVLSSCENTLKGVFSEMVADPKMLRPVDSLQFEEGLGITAWVDSSRLLIGGRELMQAYGVALPSEEIERKYTSDGMTVLYIALSGEAAAMMLVSYRADKQIMKALRLLSNRDIDICLSGMDAHLSAEMISTLYRYPDCLIHVVPESCRAELDTARKKAAVRTRPGFIYEGSLNAGVRAIAAAGTCESVMNIESALLLLSVVMGVALTAILAFMGSMSVLTWITALIFQAFWSLVSLIVPALKKS